MSRLPSQSRTSTVQASRLTHLSLLAAAMGVAFCLQARAEPFELPALNTSAGNPTLVGKLIWLDLETTDLPGARRFYGTLFGWQFRNYHAYGRDYAVAMVSDHPVAGLLRRPITRNTERPSAWLPFFSVADVAATVERAGKAHAEVRSGPENLPQRGLQARLSDPEGAVFAVLTSSSGDPPDDPNPRSPGTWGSASLLARDPASEAVFYQGLLGYAVLGEPADGGFERIRLSSGNHERAEVRELPRADGALSTQWVSFVRVFSVAETTRQALTLGGRVVTAGPRGSRGATGTILADPTGALFGVMELPPEVARRDPR